MDQRSTTFQVMADARQAMAEFDRLQKVIEELRRREQGLSDPGEPGTISSVAQLTRIRKAVAEAMKEATQLQGMASAGLVPVGESSRRASLALIELRRELENVPGAGLWESTIQGLEKVTAQAREAETSIADVGTVVRDIGKQSPRAGIRHDLHHRAGAGVSEPIKDSLKSEGSAQTWAVDEFAMAARVESERRHRLDPRIPQLNPAQARAAGEARQKALADLDLDPSEQLAIGKLSTSRHRGTAHHMLANLVHSGVDEAGAYREVLRAFEETNFDASTQPTRAGVTHGGIRPGEKNPTLDRGTIRPLEGMRPRTVGFLGDAPSRDIRGPATDISTKLDQVVKSNADVVAALKEVARKMPFAAVLS
jgi:hypothetical protein